MPKAAQLPSIHPTVNARFKMGPHLSRVKPLGSVLGACIIAKDCPCPLVIPSAMVRPSGHKSDLHSHSIISLLLLAAPAEPYHSIQDVRANNTQDVQANNCYKKPLLAVNG